MKIYLVRNAEPDSAREQYFDEVPGVPLTIAGTDRAKALAKLLTRPEWGRIYCSDLTSAVQTLLPSTNRLDVPVRYDPRIRELDDYLVGDFDGRVSTDLQLEYGELQLFYRDLLVERSDTLVVTHKNVIRFLSGRLATEVEDPEFGSVHVITLPPRKP